MKIIYNQALAHDDIKRVAVSCIVGLLQRWKLG